MLCVPDLIRKCITSAVPGMPRNVMTTVNGPRSISVSWMEPAQTNGVIQSYMLTISNEEMEVATNSTSETNFTEYMLIPFTLYTFEVVAVTNAGAGRGALSNATTEEAGRTS